MHKSYENCDSYIFKQNEVLRDRLFYLGFAILELSKLLMFETYYDELEPYFGEKNLQLHYMDTDGLVLSVNTHDKIIDLKNLDAFLILVNQMKIMNYSVIKTKN